MSVQYDPNKFTKGDIISPTRLRDKLNNMKVIKDMMVEITHHELVALRDNSELIPGCQYRITDYVCSEAGRYYRSQSHQYDIIVVADSENAINKHARATWHDGEDYFPREDIVYVSPDKEQYIYDGTIVIDGVTYYKWIDIEIAGDYGGGWDPYKWILTDKRTYPKTTHDGYYIGYKPVGGMYSDGENPVMSGDFAYLNGDDGKNKYICYTEYSSQYGTDVLVIGDNTYYWEGPYPIYKVNIEEWDLIYDIDDGTTGKVLYLKDEHGNEAEYDFKNVQFKRYRVSSVTSNVSSPDDLVGFVDRYIGQPSSSNIISSRYCTITLDSSDYEWKYTLGGSIDYSTNASSVSVGKNTVHNNSVYKNNKIIGKLTGDSVGTVIELMYSVDNEFYIDGITLVTYKKDAKIPNELGRARNTKIYSKSSDRDLCFICCAESIENVEFNQPRGDSKNVILIHEPIFDNVSTIYSDVLSEYALVDILFYGSGINGMVLGKNIDVGFVHTTRPICNWEIGSDVIGCVLPPYETISDRALVNVIIMSGTRTRYNTDEYLVLNNIIDQPYRTSSWYYNKELFTQIVGFNSNGEYKVKILLDNDINDSSISLSTTFSSSKIMQLVADAGFDVRVVRELPEEGEDKTIYMVPSSSTKDNTYYNLLQDVISSDISIGDILELHELPSVGNVITYTNNSVIDSSSIVVAASSSTNIEDITISDIGVVTGMDPLTLEDMHEYKITGIHDISDKLSPTAQSYGHGAKIYTYDDVTGVEPSDSSLTSLPCISTYRHDSRTNIKDEYIWTEGRWEMIGTTAIDLSDYYTKSETNVLLAGKSDTGHTHTKSEITDFEHTHTKSEITDFEHTHVIADITDFSITVAETIQILNAPEPTILHLSGGAPDIEIVADQGELKSSQIPSGITIESVEIGEDVEVIGKYVFKYSDLSSVTIPNTVGYIDMDAFAECANLTSIDLPDSVFEISMGAFYNCNSLTRVNFGNGIEIINEGAFQDTAITSIVLPESIVEIHERAFYGCNITTATIKATTPPYIEQNEENLFGNSCIIYVPADSVSAYQSDPEWSVYGARIQAIPTA